MLCVCCGQVNKDLTVGNLNDMANNLRNIARQVSTVVSFSVEKMKMFRAFNPQRLNRPPSRRKMV